MYNRLWDRYSSLALSGVALLAGLSLFAWISHPYWDNTDSTSSTIFLTPTAPVASPSLTTQTLAPTDLSTQKSWQQVSVADGDTLKNIFQNLGLDPKQFNAVLKLGARVTPLLALRQGQSIDFLINGNKQLEQLIFEADPLTTLTLTWTKDHFVLNIQKQTPKAVLQSLNANLSAGSLYRSGEIAGIDPKITYEISKIFSPVLSLSHLHPSDHFTAVYDTFYAGHTPLGVGDVLAARFVVNGKRYDAIRFVGADGKARYYTPQGMEVGHHGIGFLRAPLHAPISSYFNMHRFNPVLHIVRPHYGVDFAAPAGTPVHAVGPGVVSFAGTKGGYGRVVILKHRDNYTTVYAHLSRFPHGLTEGATVQEGQVIGYVGSSGVATGPNLHYEVHIGDQRENPLTVKLPSGSNLTGKALAKFLPYAHQMLAKLSA